MPVLQKYTSPLWGIWKIEESWEQLLHLSERPDEYVPFLNSIQSENRKAEWLAVRVLLERLTGASTTIAYHASGAPYLPGSPYHIGISHTKGYAAVILDPVKPAGIDIEYHSERIRKLQSRFLNETELNLLDKNPETNELLVCWSAKETTFKMTGQKAADWLRDIHITTIEGCRETGFLTVQETLTPQAATYHIRYDTTPDFVITRSQ
ncbi:MAG: 4'-phosphopantetheinyl transferase superfamily protein [Tannerella sp.]|jgi:phosphopantetheinyl transferase|nr:4'-phosphopantetheinyl transferase superfamily protein [Tannerella sp.]